MYKKDEKITTNFEPHNNEDVVSKSYLDTEISKKGGRVSFREKNYNELMLHSDEKNQSENVLLEKTVKTTIQILYDKGLFDKDHYANEVLKYLLKVTKNVDLN